MGIAPGIHTDVSAEAYHVDPCDNPSLSSSILKLLLDQSPAHAHAAHPRLNPDQEEKGETRFDFGSVAHKLVLGKGREVAVIDALDYRKKDTKEQRDKARAEGKIPILEADFAKAGAMSEAAKRQIALIPPVAEAFGEDGLSEAVVIWREGNIWCRGMADRLFIKGDRATLVDYKSTDTSAHPAAIARHLFNMAYDLQAGFYRRGIVTLQPQIKHFTFILLTQEKTPPYALSAVTLDHAAWQLAEKRIRAGLGIWARCLETGSWPAYPLAVATAELPPWIESQWLEREMNDELLAELAAPFATLSDLQHPEPKPIVEPI